MPTFILAFLCALFLALPAHAQVVGGGGGGSTAWSDLTGVPAAFSDNTDDGVVAADDVTWTGTHDFSGATSVTPVPQSATLPGTCTEGEQYHDTDSGASEIHVCTATDTWTAIPSTASITTDNTYTNSSNPATVTLTANKPLKVGNLDSAAQSFQLAGDTVTCSYFEDATLGMTRTCSTDYGIGIETNFNFLLYDNEGAATMWTIDPDAASANAMYTIASGYRWLKSAYWSAGSLNGDGTQCPASATAVTINSGPIVRTIICADNDASTLYGEATMPDAWDGGTVTLEGTFIQTAADTSNLNADVAMQCRGATEVPSSTWGTEIAMDGAMTGSNANNHQTTAAITPAGTCAGGDTLYFRWQMDATGTTTAVATLHVLGFKLEYAVSSMSD